jgi:hypothetical protein
MMELKNFQFLYFLLQFAFKLPKITIWLRCSYVRILINLAPVDFEAYLLSKKIDSVAFLGAEKELWKAWKLEFDQMNPKSFTVQKLYLINPVRRKYPLKQEQENKELKSKETSSNPPAEKLPGPVVAKPKPAMAKPVFRPKPKTN